MTEDKIDSLYSEFSKKITEESNFDEKMNIIFDCIVKSYAEGFNSGQKIIDKDAIWNEGYFYGLEDSCDQECQVECDEEG